MAAAGESRADRLNQRLRGAQRTNVGDESFSLDIAGLGASSSLPRDAGLPSSSARSVPSARDPYDLLSTSKESDGQARPPSVRSASTRRSSSRLPQDADELEVLPAPPSVKSPVRIRVSSAVEEVEESPAHAPGSGRRRSVPLSAAASSSTRLLSALSTDDAAPSSSPLADKSRRSSVRRSSARPAPTIPEDDELHEPAPEQHSETEPIQPEPELEDDSPAEEIGAEEAANALRRPRLTSSPELGSADIAEAPPKRPRGRPSNSPAKQRQPARKPKAKPQAPRRKRTANGDVDDDSKDGDAIEITVQRFVNHKRRGSSDPLQTEIPFANRSGETVVDVFAQVCDEVIATTLAQFEQLLEEADNAKKKEYRIKMRAIEAYREELNSRLLQHAIHLDHWHSLRKQILRLRGEREQVALRMDAIRVKHEAESQASTRRINASTLMHDIDLAVEQGQGAAELSRAAQKAADLGNLDLLLARVVDEASSASPAGGMLRQVTEFNALLERAALALESR
ncbi:hypothetical protein ACCO45_006466 [Purpureocillium lilacinum]|uniref:Uncharacterized protein n=1 Tax=Purpureocillium lilacinum TaxID=33203 RepID=A0ACC4DRZ2_PURLI